MSTEERVEKLQLWAASYEGKMNAHVEHQQQLNRMVEARLSSLEKRVLWLTAAAAAGGSMAPQLLKVLGVV